MNTQSPDGGGGGGRFAVTAFIALGANLGDRPAAVRAAISAIAALPHTHVVRRSSLYLSTPVDAGGPDYINAVVEVETALRPLELLHALQAIEAAAGRARSIKNAPRLLDLDLLMHGDAVHCTAELTLPHPRMHERAFVLIPLAEIAPGLHLANLELFKNQRIERVAD